MRENERNAGNVEALQRRRKGVEKDSIKWYFYSNCPMDVTCSFLLC